MARLSKSLVKILSSKNPPQNILLEISSSRNPPQSILVKLSLGEKNSWQSVLTRMHPGCPTWKSSSTKFPAVWDEKFSKIKKGNTNFCTKLFPSDHQRLFNLVIFKIWRFFVCFKSHFTDHCKIIKYKKTSILLQIWDGKAFQCCFYWWVVYWRMFVRSIENYTQRRGGNYTAKNSA